MSAVLDLARADFEEWASENSMDLAEDFVGYTDSVTCMTWKAWIASKQLYEAQDLIERNKIDLHWSLSRGEWAASRPVPAGRNQYQIVRKTAPTAAEAIRKCWE